MTPYTAPGILPHALSPDQRVFLAIQTVTGRTKEDYSIKTRKRDILYCRQVAHRLLREKTKMSLSTIGIMVGGKDHATVLNSIRVIQIEKDAYVKTGCKQELYSLYEKCREEVERMPK